MNKMLLLAASLILPIGIAHGADPPEVKEGLWSIHSQTTDNPGNKKSETSSTICRSHAYDQHVQSLAKKAAKDCTVKESFEGGKYIGESRCTVSGIVIETKGTSTFQGDTATHSETHTTYTPAFAGMTDSTMTADQKYLGSCPAGVQPGDLTTSEGQVNHLWKH
jgi:hypothetical protein